MQNNTTLESKVAGYKLIARESLRMELISPRLSAIANLESDVKDVQDEIASYSHRIDVVTYENSKLDQNHPDFAKHLKDGEETLVYYADEIKDLNESIVELQKEIDEQKKGITAIESGETKVSLDRLNALVDSMIEQDALASVSPTTVA